MSIQGPLLVGFLWGATNPLIRRGVLIAEKSIPRKFTSFDTLDNLLHHIFTLDYIIPQLLNLAASVVFAATLGSGAVSLAVPLANGTSLASTALVGHFLGDKISLYPGLPGVFLLVLGVILCSFSTTSTA